MTARLVSIQVFPVKALDPLPVAQTTVLPTGALQQDRRFALVDAAGKFINGKRTPLVHHIRSSFDVEQHRLNLNIDGNNRTFHMEADRATLVAWLSEYFSLPVQVVEDRQNGFPDDLNAPGPTVISTATLETVASWFPRLTVAEARARFRANLEVGGVEPFWEDHLYARMGEVVGFRVGGVLFEGVNPCQRCVVPSRDPQTGEAIPGFTRTFTQRREETLPSWATACRFDHFYRLAVNTRLADGQAGGVIRVGDEVGGVEVRPA
jgi:uncharacterized protein YcbX